ncbi:MAG: hypothetical protein IJL42_09255 [Bacteroidales bacterium]|nr:hypothetical protein [Bacteroidales bacterium]
MKKLVTLAVLAAMAFCSCTKDNEKIYTLEEIGKLGISIDLAYCGWSEVYNDTKETVTLITSYPMPDRHEPVTSVIKPGDFVKLMNGVMLYGKSIDECITASIILGDGTEILCSQKRDDNWSQYFFENFDQRVEPEITIAFDKKVRIDHIVKTYHINDALIEIGKAKQ